MYLYKDINTSKHLLFAFKNNVINSCSEFKFDTYILMVENWIYWATKQNDKIVQLNYKANQNINKDKSYDKIDVTVLSEVEERNSSEII